MVRKIKIDYDEENDILWAYSGEKVKDSLQIDNFVIDFSHDNKIVGVEIQDASKILNELTFGKLNKNNLSEIKEANLGFYQGRELVIIVLDFMFLENNVKKEITIQIPAPRVAMSVKN